MRQQAAAWRHQHGMSIVELLVAMAIGLMIAAGLAVMYANSSQSNRELEKTTRQIENGRYTADMLAQELAVAGFYGEVPSTGAVYAAPSPCETVLAQLGWVNSSKTRPYPIEGKSATEVAALPCAPNPAANLPAVVLRRLDTTETDTATIDNTLGQVYVQTSQCNADDPTLAFIVSRTSTDFTLRNLACTGPAKARRYLTRLYYVASCNECSGPAIDTIPTLKRVELQGAATTVTSLATGIERLAIEYGFDTNSDGIPDVYHASLSGVASAADNTWENVVTARLYILARTTEPSLGHTDTKTYALGLAGSFGPYNDAYKRRVFVTTVKMNNVAGPREK